MRILVAVILVLLKLLLVKQRILEVQIENRPTLMIVAAKDSNSNQEVKEDLEKLNSKNKNHKKVKRANLEVIMDSKFLEVIVLR